jgi:DNA-binding MarR family transcriptional regulator
VTRARAGSADRHTSTRLDDALAFRLHRTSRFLRTHLLRVLDEHGDGVSPEQYFVIAKLRERQPRRQVELAEPVLGDPPNVSRLVDALSARGLVARTPDPADRRSWLVRLTPAGSRLASTLEHHVVAERAAVFSGFDARDLGTLERLLDRLDDNLRGLLAR